MLRFFLLGLAFAAGAAGARDVVVQEKNMQFSQTRLTLKVGDRLLLRNADPYVHEVFSMSPTRTFVLPKHRQGQGASILFDRPGVVEVECAIHAGMKLRIEVRK